MNIQFFDSDGSVQTGRCLRTAGTGMIVETTLPDGARNVRLLLAHQACRIHEFWEFYRRLGGQNVEFRPVDEGK